MTDIANSENYRRRLGRGLSSLLGGAAPAHNEAESGEAQELRHIPIDAIDRNPFQPRKQFDADGITELADSIAEHGILQPLLVRALDDRLQLVAGERRWMAARKAGLTTVPCRIVDVIDKTACEFALEENLKRRDLTDLEKAHAFRKYLDHFQCSIEELGRQLSMNRSTVSNLLRLLELPEPIQHALQAGKITAGHARAILSLTHEADQLVLSGRIQAESLSVRQAEAAAKELIKLAEQAPIPNGETAESEPADTIAIDAASREADRTNHVRSLEEQLSMLLGAKVAIRLRSKESGEICIPFASNAEFERLLKVMRQRAA